MIKKNERLISIIVAAYNVEKFLPKCIESIINQTFLDIELILVNDGSTDSSGEICNFFVKKDSRFKVLHQENKGLVNARKSGLSIATGKYVLYIDGDDYVEPEFCELLIKETYNYDADIVIGGYIRNYRGRMISVNNILPTGRYEKENIEKENVLIITDDLNLSFGTIRIKSKGSDGGHNGLKNIQLLLNSTEYPRFRFGISDAFKKGKQVDYVLGNWDEDEKIKLPERLEMASEIIKSFGLAGLEITMTSFNGK